jgi:hypothetical protein
MDRILHPEEMLQAMGWVNTNTGSLTMAELTDLVGEAQALPSLAVATWSSLLAVGIRLERVWTG